MDEQPENQHPPRVTSDVASTEQERKSPNTTPVGAPQTSRTAPASGDRGSGGGLGDAAGGARQATASEMTGDTTPMGDISVPMPPGGSATQGAAVGAGLSRGAADPQRVGDADPGADGDLTGDPPTVDRPSGDEAQSGLGDNATGGRLQDLDAAIRKPHETRR